MIEFTSPIRTEEVARRLRTVRDPRVYAQSQIDISRRAPAFDGLRSPLFTGMDNDAAYVIGANDDLIGGSLHAKWEAGNEFAGVGWTLIEESKRSPDTWEVGNWKALLTFAAIGEAVYKASGGKLHQVVVATYGDDPSSPSHWHWITSKMACPKFWKPEKRESDLNPWDPDDKDTWPHRLWCKAAVEQIAKARDRR